MPNPTAEGQTTTMFGYGRASTDKQQITLGAQEHACRMQYELQKSAGADLEWGGWFPDAAVTSKIPFRHRPMGELLLKMAKPGDIVIASNFDRMFRSILDCESMIQIVDDYKININTLDVEFNTKTPAGRGVIRIMAAIVNMERDMISHRTKEGLGEKARHNLPVTNWSPIGWDKVGSKSKSRFVPNETERAIGYEVVRLHEEEGKSFRSMAEIFYQSPIYESDKKRTTRRRYRLRLMNLYVAAKCGFPMIYRNDLPTTSALKSYMDSHAGRPPLLERGAWLEGRFYTLPPKPDPEPISIEQDDL